MLASQHIATPLGTSVGPQVLPDAPIHFKTIQCNRKTRSFGTPVAKATARVSTGKNLAFSRKFWQNCQIVDASAYTPGFHTGWESWMEGMVG